MRRKASRNVSPSATPPKILNPGYIRSDFPGLNWDEEKVEKVEADHFGKPIPITFRHLGENGMRVFMKTSGLKDSSLSRSDDEIRRF